MNRTAQYGIRAVLLSALAVATFSSAAFGQEYPPADPPQTGNLQATVSSNGVVDVSGEHCGRAQFRAVLPQAELAVTRCINLSSK